MEEELDHKNEIDDLQKEGMWQLFFIMSNNWTQLTTKCNDIINCCFVFC